MRLLPLITASLVLLAGGCGDEDDGCSGSTCGTPLPDMDPGGPPAPSSGVCPTAPPEWEVHASDLLDLDGAFRFDGTAAAVRASDGRAVVVGTTAVERAGILGQALHAELDEAGQETRTTHDLGYKRRVRSAGFADNGSACLVDEYLDDASNRVLRIDATGAMEWATGAPDVVAVAAAEDGCLAAGHDDTAAFATALGAGGATWRQPIAPLPPATTSAAMTVVRSGAALLVAGVDSVGPIWAGTAGEEEGWVAWLDASGAIVSRAYLGIGEGDVPGALAVGPGGEVYVSGWRVGCYEVGAFVAKLRPDGSREWLRTFEKDARIDAMAVDSSGNAWVAGAYADYDGIAVRTSATYALVARIDRAGGLRWARRLGGDGNGVSVAHAIAFDAHGNAVLSGTTGAIDADREGFLVVLDEEGRRRR